MTKQGYIQKLEEELEDIREDTEFNRGARAAFMLAIESAQRLRLTRRPKHKAVSLTQEEANLCDFALSLLTQTKAVAELRDRLK